MDFTELGGFDEDSMQGGSHYQRRRAPRDGRQTALRYCRIGAQPKFASSASRDRARNTIQQARCNKKV